VPLIGSAPGRALASQAVVLEKDANGSRMFAPVTSRPREAVQHLTQAIFAATGGETRPCRPARPESQRAPGSARVAPSSKLGGTGVATPAVAMLAPGAVSGLRCRR
jgi:hypothetical protein